VATAGLGESDLRLATNGLQEAAALERAFECFQPNDSISTVSFGTFVSYTS
jgi:hypothetical protein